MWSRETADFRPLTRFFLLPSASSWLPLVQLPPEIKELPCLSLGAREGGTDSVLKWFSPWVCLGIADLVWFLPAFPNAQVLWESKYGGTLWWEGTFCRVAFWVWLTCPGVLSYPFGLGPLPLPGTSLTQMIQKHVCSLNSEQSSLGYFTPPVLLSN